MVTMTLIGFVRYDEFGADVDLYQCPKCKIVMMDSCEDNPECPVCKGD